MPDPAAAHHLRVDADARHGGRHARLPAGRHARGQGCLQDHGEGLPGAAREAGRRVEGDPGRALMGRPRDIERKIKLRELDGKEVEVTVGEACVRARKLGAPLRDCAAFAGISAATLHNWTARGREHRPDYEDGQTLEDVPATERVYVEFLDQMDS